MTFWNFWWQIGVHLRSSESAAEGGLGGAGGVGRTLIHDTGTPRSIYPPSCSLQLGVKVRPIVEDILIVKQVPIFDPFNTDFKSAS